MPPEYESDTDGIRKVYEYIKTKANETGGTLDTVDVSYVMGSLNMWLIDHEIPVTSREVQASMEAPYESGWNPFKRRA